MNQITVSRLFEEKRDAFELEPLTSSLDSLVPITVSDINRPGLAMAGYVGNFLSERVQVIGETEVGLLASYGEAQREEALDRVFQFQVPCIIVCKNLAVPDSLLARAEAKNIPVLVSPMSTTPFIHELTAYLDDLFAPIMTSHGSLVDVYGVGLLFTGRSGIGKSEIALDLVERGHRLVTDDVVTVKKRHENVLIGSANRVLGHHVEIRGVGIIDLQKVYGIRAIRFQKRIEVEVHLEDWDHDQNYERTGLEDRLTEKLGVPIPVVTVPVFPGKNITVIAETIALNYLVKAYGFDAAREFDQKLKEIMVQNSKLKSLARDDLE
ncbi:MAG: HPr(Ser) kinase/phosphatase [Candidatus Eisenbacteria bacterium]|uniref:HPr kinase/phosphorylase n=1 Tax=Eiseniibacteriota bacterium TaxID=2212470 RepID=A0A7Y2E7Q4_UNCEI|nr:HPr(Ser) kinase/phosphatase [Candidatus Eisenbacteria bacterium]